MFPTFYSCGHHWLTSLDSLVARVCDEKVGFSVIEKQGFFLQLGCDFAVLGF